MNPEDRCFCELAPLYALNLLDDYDRWWVEQQIAECPDLADELNDFQTAISAIPYSAPDVPMAADLKDRLFQRIEAIEATEVADELTATADPQPEPAQPSSAHPTTSTSSSRSRFHLLQERLKSLFRSNSSPLINLPRVVKRSQELHWRPFRVPGVTVAPLNIDLLRREATALVRAEPGVRYPVHCHADFEEIYMLEGDLIIGEEVFYAGDYIRSGSGSTHAPETHGGCMFLVRTSLADEYPKPQSELRNR